VRREREEWRWQEAEELGAGDEELPLFLPTPSRLHGLCGRGVGCGGGFPFLVAMALCWLLPEAA